jgi:hypothetical protein
MTNLSNFTPDDRAFLIRMPYQVGLWMSHIEDEAGDADDVRELARLKLLVTTIARRKSDNEFMTDVFRSLADVIVDRELVVDTEETLTEVIAAVRTVLAVGNLAEAKAYAGAMLEIATAVARANLEEPDYAATYEQHEGFLGKLTSQVGTLWGQIRATINADMNISPAEDTALTDLSAAIKQALDRKAA